MSCAGFCNTSLLACGLIAMLGSPVPQAVAAAPNDNFANAIFLSGLTNVTATNIGATAEPGEPAHAGEPASKSLWWRWTPPPTTTGSSY